MSIGYAWPYKPAYFLPMNRTDMYTKRDNTHKIVGHKVQVHRVFQYDSGSKIEVSIKLIIKSLSNNGQYMLNDKKAQHNSRIELQPFERWQIGFFLRANTNEIPLYA